MYAKHLKLCDDLGITHLSLWNRFHDLFSSEAKKLLDITLICKPMEFSAEQRSYIETLMRATGATGALHGVEFINDLMNDSEMLKKFIEHYVEAKK